MSTNIKTILLTTTFSIIFALLTYLVALNKAFVWFELKQLSNDFLLAIFSGVFASMLVVLICEIQKYFINKRDAENRLYCHTTEMLAIFISNRNNLLKLKRHSNAIINEGLLVEFQNQIRQQINFYFGVDYTTFWNRNPINRKRPHFNNFVSQKIQSVIIECYNLDIAINLEKTKMLELGIKSNNITSSNVIVANTIQIFIKKFDECIDKIASFIKTIDYSGRYLFDNIYFELQRDNEKIMKDKTFEDFLKENENLIK